MSVESNFIDEIVENKKDINARLVYADWLEERGDTRGNYLRAEIAFAESEPVSEEARQAFRKIAGLILNKRSTFTKEWVQMIGMPFDYWLMKIRYQEMDYASEYINRPIFDTFQQFTDLSELDAIDFVYSKLPRLVKSNLTLNKLLLKPHQFDSPDPASKPTPDPIFLIRKPEANPVS